MRSAPKSTGVFDFFFSLYDLVLGLSVTVIATGVASTFEYCRHVRIGYLTPLLAVFVLLDIASFWETAWTSFRQVTFSYGLLVIGMAISLTYFIAASLVFPRQMDAAETLDAQLWRNKRTVLLLTTLANALMLAAVVALVAGTPPGPRLLVNYGATGALYAVLIVPAALARRQWLVTLLVGLHTAIYLALAALSLAAIRAVG